MADTKAFTPGQEKMAAYVTVMPTMFINGKSYVKRPPGLKFPLYVAWFVVFVILMAAVSGSEDAAPIVFGLMVIVLIVIIFKAYPTRFIHQEYEEYQILEQGCLENPVDAACSCQKVRAEVDGKGQGYVQPAKCCDSGCCYEIGCLCKGQAIKYKVYVKPPQGGDAELKYTLRETIQCCGCISQCITKAYYSCMSQIIPYTHFTQNLYGPDLNDKTVMSTVKWLTFRGELMSFGASTTQGKEATVQDTASKLVIPNLYNEKGLFPPSGIQLNVSQVTNTFKAAKDVV